MSEERLIRVESFSELGVGMLIIVKPCGWCGSAHRRMLIRKRLSTPTLVQPDGGRFAQQPVWEGLPEVRCGNSGKPLVLSAITVANGIVYRIVEANPQAETTEAAEVRPKKRTKAGVR